MRSSLGLAALLAALTACSTAPHSNSAPRATTTPTSNTPTRHAVANLASASGSLVSGRLLLASTPSGVRISGDIGGLQPNAQHGFHIHEKGDCSAVDGSAAGGHFNPDKKPHGRVGAGPHHAGDSDNIVADTQGVAHLNIVLNGISLGSGAGNDVANRALIVHAVADDYTSQPAGNAGARVACGVIRLSQP